MKTKEKINMENNDSKKESLLNELYNLVLKEQERELHNNEVKRYMDIVDECNRLNIEIPFGVEI